MSVYLYAEGFSVSSACLLWWKQRQNRRQWAPGHRHVKGPTPLFNGSKTPRLKETTSLFRVFLWSFAPFSGLSLFLCLLIVVLHLFAVPLYLFIVLLLFLVVLNLFVVILCSCGCCASLCGRSWAVCGLFVVVFCSLVLIVHLFVVVSRLWGHFCCFLVAILRLFVVVLCVFVVIGHFFIVLISQLSDFRSSLCGLLSLSALCRWHPGDQWACARYARSVIHPWPKDRENDSWSSWRRRRLEGRQALCNLAFPLRQQRGTASARTLLDDRSRVLRSDWLSAAPLNGARFPGCSCQTQATVWIRADVLSHRPASHRARFIRPLNKKSCKWECLLYHTVIFERFKILMRNS